METQRNFGEMTLAELSKLLGSNEARNSRTARNALRWLVADIDARGRDLDPQNEHAKQLPSQTYSWLVACLGLSREALNKHYAFLNVAVGKRFDRRAKWRGDRTRAEQHEKRKAAIAANAF